MTAETKGKAAAEKRRWEILQAAADKRAKEQLLAALLAATGLDEYIAEAIAAHERQHHD
jgi:hypothetical protein